MIGVEWARDARERLEAAGADVRYEESEIGHHIDPRFLAELPDVGRASRRARSGRARRPARVAARQLSWRAA